MTVADLAESKNQTARQSYEASLAHALHAIELLQSRNFRLIWVRTVLFSMAAVGLFLGYFGEFETNLLLILGWLSAAGFFAAIVRHEHLRLARMRHESDANLYRHLLARLDRNWESVPEQKLQAELSGLAFADDLDVGGPASLLGLLCLATTPLGKGTLQNWIAETPSWPVVRERQTAVKALTPERDFRLRVIKTIRSASDGTEDVYGLPAWGRTPNWLPAHRIAHILSYIGPAIVIGSIAAFVFFMGQKSTQLVNIAAISLGVGFVLNILITVFWGSWIHDIFQRVTGEHSAVFQFADVFASFRELPRDDGKLDVIRRIAVEDENCAMTGFSKLMWLVRLANFQRDLTLYLVYLVLQLVFLWDFRILKLLERWKDRFGREIDPWFEALGTAESLISSATLADENPNWNYMQASTQDDILLSAKSVGHPLLPDNARVCNDLELRQDEPLLLVTGSNMAGKSTFLRAVGLNLLLVRTGAPVCAEEFASPLYELATSIRIRDSLRDGVSFFMAELQRLKEVVDLARTRAEERKSSEGAAPILFLLDEVLQGTNSQERQIAVASVLGQLTRAGASGLVSTHDLDLASADEVESISQVVHFREYFTTEEGREVMRFDYRMRPGATPTTNALKLLKLVGLNPETGESKSTDQPPI